MSKGENEGEGNGDRMEKAVGWRERGIVRMSSKGKRREGEWEEVREVKGSNSFNILLLFSACHFAP